MLKKSNLQKSGNAIYICCAAAVGVCWFGGNYVNDQLRKLPVHELKQFEAKQGVSRPVTFFPAVAKAPQGPANVTDPSADIDDVFLKKEDSVPDSAAAAVAPQETKYGDLVRQRITVDSVIDNGAVINGQFTPVGARVDQISVPAPAAQAVVPVLTAVGPHSIKLMVKNEEIVVNVAMGGVN